MISFAQVLTEQWSDTIPCWNVWFQVRITCHDIPFQHYLSIYDFFKVQEETEGQPQEGQSREPQAQTPHAGTLSSSCHRWQQEGQGKGTQCQGTQGSEVEEVSIPSLPIMSNSFWYNIPASYPDWLLTVPISQAVDFVLLNTPVNIIRASKFKNFVHLSPDVVVPKEIQMQLSVGMKYMFPNKQNTKLFGQAWNDFEERIHWRLFFAFNKPKDKIDLFDPDYEFLTLEKKNLLIFLAT